MSPAWERASTAPHTWLTTLRRYLVFAVLANLAWEIAQLPLYTIWWTGSWGEIAFAVAHCTLGDALIASTSLLGAPLLLGNSRWPMNVTSSLQGSRSSQVRLTRYSTSGSIRSSALSGPIRV